MEQENAQAKLAAGLKLECHGSAGTPLRTHADGEDSGLEESRPTVRT
jgi:hypothetical protein